MKPKVTKQVNGKHELFPDSEEIYAALGRYPPAKVEEKAPAMRVKEAVA